MVIRCPDSNNTNSTTGGTALPKFAIRGMLKTFGLHGVVLDVDSVSTKHKAGLQWNIYFYFFLQSCMLKKETKS